MIYQLCNGKAIEFSTEQFCFLSDSEFNDSISLHTSHNEGQTQENPWFGSVLMKSPPPEEYFDPATAGDTIVPDMTVMELEEKIGQLDMAYFADD